MEFNILNDEVSRALLAYTRYICASLDKPLEQGDGLLQQYLASTSGILAPTYPEAPHPPTAGNLSLEASTPGVQSDAPVTVNPESGGGFSPPQIGSVSPGNKFAEYDPLWVDRQSGVSRVAVANFKSTFSFDDLFRFRVIKPQDVLMLHDVARYHRVENNNHHWESASVLLTVRSCSFLCPLQPPLLTHRSATLGPKVFSDFHS